MKGLLKDVRVIRDENAIPHIFANNDLDAFQALGYLHAQDRMWQMEFQRRLGQGRMSEILGVNSLLIDRYMRTLGLYRSAKSAVSHLDTQAAASLNAYVNGVNEWINSAQVLPVEFKIFGIEPQQWAPEDSIVLMKMMALNLGFNYQQELVLDLLIKEIGKEKAYELFPNYPKDSATITTQEPATESLSVNSEIELLSIHKNLQDSYRMGFEGLGSNAWTISGEHTQSGQPLLAADPHLGTEIPSIWYLAELSGERLHVTGATYPGLPFVWLGHNNNIAWGGASLTADVQDLYIEKLNPLNENQYEFNGQWVDMEVIDEYIKVKQDFPEMLRDAIPPLKWQVRTTKNGPLLSDGVGTAEMPISLKWTALTKNDTSFNSFMKLNYASNWTEFKQALTGFVAPALNFVYSDVEGNIAYIAAGKVPIRNKGDGRLPVIGWTGEYDWNGFIPLDEMPQVLNPKSGYIVAANNKAHSDEYPYLISNDWAPPYRADRIEELLTQFIANKTKLTVKDFQLMQGDVTSLQVREILPFLQALEPKSERQVYAVNLMKQWDGVLTQDSEAAAIYQIWLRHFNHLIVSDELRGNLLTDWRLAELFKVIGDFRPVFIKQNLIQDEDSQLSDWCDHIRTKPIENCEKQVLESLTEAVVELSRYVGKDKTWGGIHSAHYPHQAFVGFPILDLVFDREVSTSGGAYTINNTKWTWSQSNAYRQIAGASYRQVIDLGNWNNSGFINNTGQSGNILSEYYDNNIQPHQDLELHPMTFNNDAADVIGKELKLIPQQ
ncbi:penicillin acylase family protein [Marinicellulosiphila megalodicopiae]|uniref:penicillin acylase family protein n=1 Tax=Marinicellulosiphila megalodicopiae TaxID=2724896 RepID=UPI003BB0F54E